MNNPLFIPLPDFLLDCVYESYYFLMSHTWFLAYKEEVHIAAYDGQRECFFKNGGERFWEASLLSASYTSRFILDSRHERETKKKLKRTQEEQFLELSEQFWMTWWEKKLVKMKVWFININNNVFITHRFLK